MTSLTLPLELWHNIIDEVLFDPRLFSPSLFHRSSINSLYVLLTGGPIIELEKSRSILCGVCKAWKDYASRVYTRNVNDQGHEQNEFLWFKPHPRVLYACTHSQSSQEVATWIGNHPYLRTLSFYFMIGDGMGGDIQLLEAVASLKNLRYLSLFWSWGSPGSMGSLSSLRFCLPHLRYLNLIVKTKTIESFGYLDLLVLEELKLRINLQCPPESSTAIWMALGQFGKTLIALEVDIRRESYVIAPSYWKSLPSLQYLKVPLDLIDVHQDDTAFRPNLHTIVHNCFRSPP